MTCGFPHTTVGIPVRISSLVQEGSVYDPMKRMWVWHYHDGDQQLDFNVETGEFIRFRVVALQYNRIESTHAATLMNLENNTVVTSEVKKVEREPEPTTRHRTQSIDVQGPEISRVRSASIDMKEEKMLPPNPMAIIISF